MDARTMMLVIDEYTRRGVERARRWGAGVPDDVVREGLTLAALTYFAGQLFAAVMTESGRDMRPTWADAPIFGGKPDPLLLTIIQGYEHEPD